MSPDLGYFNKYKGANGTLKLRDVRNAFELEIILKVMEAMRGNITLTSNYLGMKRTCIKMRLVKAGLRDRGSGIRKFPKGSYMDIYKDE